MSPAADLHAAGAASAWQPAKGWRQMRSIPDQHRGRCLTRAPQRGWCHTTSGTGRALFSPATSNCMQSREIEVDISCGAPKAVVSYDRKHWTRTETEYDERSGNLIIKHTPKYVRPCPPYILAFRSLTSIFLPCARQRFPFHHSLDLSWAASVTAAGRHVSMLRNAHPCRKHK